MGAKKYPDWLVAKVKGACMIGIPQKIISKASGIPVASIAGMSFDRRKRVEPDHQAAMECLRSWFVGDATPNQALQDKSDPR